MPSHVGGPILLLGAWVPDCRMGGSSIQGRGAWYLGDDGAGVPQKGLVAGEGLVINLHHISEAGGWGWSVECVCVCGGAPRSSGG